MEGFECTAVRLIIIKNESSTSQDFESKAALNLGCGSEHQHFCNSSNKVCFAPTGTEEAVWYGAVHILLFWAFISTGPPHIWRTDDKKKQFSLGLVVFHPI